MKTRCAKKGSQMTKNRANGISRRRDRSKEAGQATLFLVLALGIFLLGALCFAFDMSNMWFHRQAAQTAADAACTAGAMDLLVDAQGGATGDRHQFARDVNHPLPLVGQGHPGRRRMVLRHLGDGLLLGDLAPIGLEL